ncbi:type II and III secretion system protein family protein [Sinorhizobium alkalisoli]|uniref:type II and III secretion system protein family protein n=1 Tax=Sinorhizobium alkalisoli TaxID=1752398 RepID=UPI00124DC866|nr:type II and III secretion system protein family protein [Sinorhizobium alkalisoli]QFI65875.1 Type II/IV secretion system secretin RcpA/CpaC, associated with Flp pilus assembly [Sinorhizobium alkalisoli]
MLSLRSFRAIAAGELITFILMLMLSSGVLAPPVNAQVKVDAINGQVLELTVGQGQILRFDEPVESVFLADTAIADVRVVSPGVVYIYATKIGDTNLIALSADQSTRGTVQVRVSGNPRAAEQSALALQPTTKVDISLFGGQYVGTGQTRNVGEAMDMENVLESYSTPDKPALNNTTIAGTNQVNIRVRFAEVARNELTRFGIDWSVFVNSGSFSFGIVRTGGASNEDDTGISIGARGDHVNVNVLLDALQANGILTILAEPNITAVTGQTASFLAGGEIPVPVPVGNDQIGIEYKQFGVSLQFTPTLLPNNRIALQVRPEVSSVSQDSVVSIGGLVVPSLRIRRADTTVEVGSGQTFAIAGLFQRQESQTLNKTPVVGDVPILGELFKSKRFQRNETELVILITPYLVSPTSERKMKTPLDSPSGAITSPRNKNKPVVNKGYGFYVE